jgi:hypothetical protein
MASIAISSQPRRSSDSCSLPRASRTHPHMSPSPNSQSLALARLSTCAARRLAPLGDGPPPPMGQAVVSPSFPNALGLVVDLRSSLAPSLPAVLWISSDLLCVLSSRVPQDLVVAGGPCALYKWVRGMPFAAPSSWFAAVKLS